MRPHGKTTWIALTFALAAVASGCSGGMQMSSAKMCAAHGGTYDAVNKTCSYTQSTRSAQQICEAHSGYYDTAADVCRYNP